jgi:hypothetical protein
MLSFEFFRFVVLFCLCGKTNYYFSFMFLCRERKRKNRRRKVRFISWAANDLTLFACLFLPICPFFLVGCSAVCEGGRGSGTARHVRAHCESPLWTNEGLI